MGEKVGGVGNEDNQTALNLGEPAEVSELQQQRSSHAHQETNEHTAEEDEQKDAGTLEEADKAEIAGFALVILLRRLEDDDGNGIVQDRLSKDDGIQLGVDLVGVEDGQDGDGIGGGQCCANGNGVNEANVQRPRNPAEEPQNQANDNSREEGTGKRKCQDGAYVPEEVGLVQLVARGQDNGGQQEVEEDLVVEADEVSNRVARGDEENETDNHACGEEQGECVD